MESDRWPLVLALLFPVPGALGQFAQKSGLRLTQFGFPLVVKHRVLRIDLHRASIRIAAVANRANPLLVRRHYVPRCIFGAGVGEGPRSRPL